MVSTITFYYDGHSFIRTLGRQQHRDILLVGHLILSDYSVTLFLEGGKSLSD